MKSGFNLTINKSKVKELIMFVKKSKSPMDLLVIEVFNLILKNAFITLSKEITDSIVKNSKQERMVN